MCEVRERSRAEERPSPEVPGWNSLVEPEQIRPARGSALCLCERGTRSASKSVSKSRTSADLWADSCCSTSHSFRIAFTPSVCSTRDRLSSVSLPLSAEENLDSELNLFLIAEPEYLQYRTEFVF